MDKSAAHIPYSAEEQAGIDAYRLAVENAYATKSGVADSGESDAGPGSTTPKEREERQPVKPRLRDGPYGWWLYLTGRV